MHLLSGSVVNSCHRPLMSYNIEILYLAFRRLQKYSAVVVKSSIMFVSAFTVSHSLSLSAFEQSLAVTLKLLCQSFSCHFSTVTNLDTLQPPTENSCCVYRPLSQSHHVWCYQRVFPSNQPVCTLEVQSHLYDFLPYFSNQRPCFWRHFSKIPAAEKENNQSFAGKQKLDPRVSGLSLASSVSRKILPYGQTRNLWMRCNKQLTNVYEKGWGWGACCISLRSSNSHRIPNTEHREHRKQDSRETVAINN